VKAAHHKESREFIGLNAPVGDLDAAYFSGRSPALGPFRESEKKGGLLAGVKPYAPEVRRAGSGSARAICRTNCVSCQSGARAVLEKNQSASTLS